MDTILYFYKKRNLTKPIIETFQMQDYLLVKVGMNVWEDRWFSHSAVPCPPEAPQKGRAEERRPERAAGEGPALLFRRYREKRKEKRRQKELAEHLRKEQEQVRREMKELTEELDRIVDQRYECLCAYGEEVRRALIPLETAEASSWLAGLWQQYWNLPEFRDYLSPRWTEPLLGRIRQHAFVVLGTAPCTFGILLRCAWGMKSLKWLLKEEDCDEELQDFVEDFYDECGLAINLQPLEGQRPFSRLMLETGEPVCVLDFTQEPRIPSEGLAPDSLWIDFRSLEEKGRRISQRADSVAYLSLKEIWKRAGKP